MNTEAREYIIHLLNTFPSLKSRFQDLTPETWDADDFMARTGGMSTAEKQAALFVVCVWNPGYAELSGWAFDYWTAISTWDLPHRHAFAQWSQDPNWP